MAPEVNGVSRPSGPSQPGHTTSSSTQQSPSLSRRTSSVMGPPPVPQNSSLPNSPRPLNTSADTGAFTASLGPIRHPRPLTAAELHLELEKEQESIVNRLTRELSALRAQTASVASTASSTSDLFTTTQNDPYLYPYNAPNIIPTTARRHRSSSNLSSRSARSTRDTLANNAAAATSISGVAAPRDREHAAGGHSSHTQSHQNSSRPSIDIPRPEISRQNSTSGSFYRVSTSTALPSATSPHWAAQHAATSYPYPHPRHSVSSQVGNDGVVNTYARSPSTSISTAQAQARYEEAAVQRAELDAVKRENEALKMKIRELEKSLLERTASGVSGSGGGSGGTLLRNQAEGDGDGGAPLTS